MRLLSVHSLQLQQFHDEETLPEYAILSHTWGEEEVTLQDLRRDSVHQMKGYQKVQKSCERARSDSLDYIWIDTCCIDKTSSAELSEAINSMFKWYERSARCYAYLQDVREPHGTPGSAGYPKELADRLAQSRYWTRGWTLQELIAPAEVWFYDELWEFVGTRSGLSTDVARITCIDRDMLIDRDTLMESARSSLETKSVAKRMSWVAARKTTRQEDLAYCLLGIFDINMPLLYGEGITKAFHRLQVEILRTCTDQTILAWIPPTTFSTGALAPHPKYFASCGNLVTVQGYERASEMTNLGLKINMRVLEGWKDHKFFAILACRDQDDFFNLTAIPLWQEHDERLTSQPNGKQRINNKFKRSYLKGLVPWPTKDEYTHNLTWRTIYISTHPIDTSWIYLPEHLLLTRWPESCTITAYPPSGWNPRTRTMNFRDSASPEMRGAFAITLTESAASPSATITTTTFGVGFRVLGNWSGNVRLFARPERHGGTWLKDMAREMKYGMFGTESDSMRVWERDLKVRIEQRWMLGKSVFTIEPVWGVGR